jgi:peptidoglycan/xylan/chitin deacetylase (PgdA/CDA1 family)
MTIGGHTVTHPVLARASNDRQRTEVSGCGARLAAELGERMRYFSYPVGGPDTFTDVTRECLKQAGVQFAFSYYGGFRRFSDWDDFDIRRVPVDLHMTRDWVRSAATLPQFFA